MADVRPIPLLQLEDVSVGFGGLKALSRVSLSVGAGEVDANESWVTSHARRRTASG